MEVCKGQGAIRRIGLGAINGVYNIRRIILSVKQKAQNLVSILFTACSSTYSMSLLVSCLGLATALTISSASWVVVPSSELPQQLDDQPAAFVYRRLSNLGRRSVLVSDLLPLDDS